MPDDEVHQKANASAFTAETGGDRTGPRHAAPKKPLLTRLHVPAGKAMAIAAMPSAVLMGMGLTPQLASAETLPGNPLRDDHCVSQEDREAEEALEEKAEETEKEKAEREKAAGEKAGKEEAQEEEPSSSSPDDSASAEPGSGDSGSEDSGSEDSGGEESGGEESGGEESGESEKKNPLDPLGWGEKVKDFFTPGDEESEKAGNSGESEKSGEAGDAPAAGESGKSADGKSGSSAAESQESGGSGKAADDAADRLADRIEEAAGKAGNDSQDRAGEQEDGDGDATAAFPRTEAEAKEQAGKEILPCVEEKKSGGEDEQAPATLPNEPWQLHASSLALHGLSYKGVVNVQTADGRTKQALKFTADSLDIGDLHQTVEGPDGTTYHVKAAEGSTSTIRGGQVTMYTEQLKGNLFGLIPITFDPEHPPPVDIPEVYFTKVLVTQAGQFGGNLTIPGLHQYV